MRTGTSAAARQRARSIITPVLIATALLLAGCRAGEPAGNGEATAGDQVVERSTHDGIETVTTISGSRWNDARLVEELSIGEEIGADAYLFGAVASAWATDERIYMVDAQVPAVRAFDHEGRHLHDVGRPGQGPGEYGPMTTVAVMDNGTVVVADAIGARLNLYDGEGTFLEDWPVNSQKSALGLVISYDGQLFTQAWSNDVGRMGVQAIGPDGPTGDLSFPPLIEFQPPRIEVGKGLAMLVPFAPTYTWSMAPGGEMLAGIGDTYRFEVHRPGGAVTIVERHAEPTPVSPEEAEFRADIATTSLRMIDPSLAISGSQVPTHKPSLSGFYADRAGRAWVIRPGPGRADPECADAGAAIPQLSISTGASSSMLVGAKMGRLDAEAFEGRCWSDTFSFDLFEVATGEFLGTVEAPEAGFLTPLFADGEWVLAAVADELGTVRLKRYRLDVE